MIKKILLVFLISVLVFVIVAALRPNEFSVSRSITIKAAPATVFAHVNDFHKWEAWSPYAKLDPAMKTTYEGAPAGVGAIYTWSGNNQVGEGRTTILESKPNEQIGIKLDFVRPFAGTNDVKFDFKPEGDQTVVSWTMKGYNNFMSKAIGIIIDVNKMLGAQFDQGLSQLKGVVESADKK